MYRVLNDLRKKPYKMMKRHELTEDHERKRAERSRHILNEITQGAFLNLVFTDQKKFTFTRSPDLSPMNFSIWFILKTRALATPHTSLEFLKAELQREWETIPQEQIK
ncbi:hypothetical protein FHG87_024561 [Trinorchestia longiramus]|nr:hypothetical protein FHG87_024561 [Trinorchestia longiramus]